MLLRLFLLSTILISSAHPLFGQAMDGNLTGTISDPSGAALKGASLELLNGATGVRFSIQSSDAGVYRFTNVLPGRYQLTATLAGFQTPDLAKKLGHEADYFATNAARMNYPKFRKQHLFIGSKVIEAACRTVVGHRLKQSGMFWTVKGANSILALRCSHLNGRFEGYWEGRQAACRTPPSAGVRIHGWSLMHNHSHWIFEASTEESISNVMRDMQSRYSHYLNVKYRATPWLLIAPLFGVKDIDHFAPYLRSGPVNWTPRFGSRFLDAKGFREFLLHLENNPVKAGLAQRGQDWPWSSAKAHCTGVDAGNLLTFDLWQHIFGNPDNIAGDWQTYLEGPLDEVRQNAARVRGLHAGSRLNRPMGWISSRSPPAG